MNNLLKKLPFYDQTWFSFLRFLLRHYIEDNCQQKAASLTYTTMLSIVPIITVLLMILSSVPALESVRDQISQVIYSNLLPQSSLQVSEYINSFAEKSSNLTAIGAMVLFVTSIMTLTTIERAFNQIWRVEGRSGGFKSVIRYWTIITLGPLVLGTAFIVSSAVQSLSFLNQQIAGYGIDWGFWVQVVSYIVTVAGFIGMYWFIPKARVPFKSAAIAGIFVAVLFELLKYFFGTLMSNFTSYEAIYGAFAALPIFLLWIYLSWNLILLGVEISYTLTIYATGEVYPRHPLLSLLDMLNLTYDNHKKGKSVSETELRNVLGRKELPKWFTYLNYLQDSNLITITEDGNYVLKKDLNGITLWDFYRTLPYPLPIKDELDELDPNLEEPWLSMLTQRLINTEKCAKKELNLSLCQVFDNAPPRKKVKAEDGQNEQPKAHLSSTKTDKSVPADTPKHFEPEAFESDAPVVEDNSHTEAVIPDDSIESPDLESKSSQRASKRHGLFGAFAHDRDKPLITEEDNPEK